MVVAVISKNMLFKVFLSDTPDGDYQIRDYFNVVIGNIVYVDNKLQFNANHNFEIQTDKGVVASCIVSIGTVFNIKNIVDQTIITVYIYSSNVENSIEIKPKKNKIVIGKASDCDICYNSPYLRNHAYSLLSDKGMWFLETIDDYVYVNDRLVKRKRVDHGDVIFVGGLKVFCLGDTVVVAGLLNNYTVQLNNGTFDKKQPITQEIRQGVLELEDDKEVFGDDKFQRSPRFRSILKEREIEFASPPNVNPPKVMPAILTLGPQLTMFITSGFTMFTSLSSVFAGQSTLTQVMPSILMSLIMTISGLLWPTLTRKYQKKENAKMRIFNTKNYRKYLVTKEKEINEIIAEQKQILIENNVSLEECQQIIFRRKRNLWEKTLFDDDFLQVRVGIGIVPPRINFRYDSKGFGTDESALESELHDLIKRVSYVDDVPVNTSLVQNRITAIIGNAGDLRLFFESILLQIATFHLYSELKIIVFTDNTKYHDWDYLKYLPHCWDNSHTTRFICRTIDEKKRLSSYIENIIKERKGALKDKGDDDDGTTYTNFLPYFLVITDNINDAKQFEGINQILNTGVNLGFSLLIKNNRIANLPSQCSTFINIDKENSGLFKNDLDENNQLHFTAELNTTINVEDCFRELANIYVDVPLDKHELPKSVGFLAMYDVGNVEQLNSGDRWIQNNPVNSLAVPVGIDQSGNIFNFDIHEKAYGPHGLVAGTTGSGKSEWLITYILSLCVNFSPEEVQFVLIDYKGGGLAGSFDNKETGMHLPHLVGTITNLDKSEIRRSLASLEAESKRRQRMFNEAREKLNDSSMNIYKYQQYYRKGMLDEPLSHLFIISDEFAELKAQEPEFLEQLVSIARIGRSLGIHLILATQKPAGVVDEQIKSNSKFKICLRVQDKADSKDMINVDDAAYLHQTGAFYMLVGLDEVFTLGQSAYAGGLYKPTKIVKKEVDTSVTILGQTGEEIDSADMIVADNNQINQDVHGEELLNIILYVSNISKQKTMKIRKLWLEAIPEIIYVDNLKKKYNTTRIPFRINPIIGEYDNPFEQKQSVLQLDLNKGNTYITGVSGSGKEQLLQTMIYSIITTFTPQEVNIYICDFGAETLAMFKDSPHVGSVTYMSEVEKIKNTFRFAKKIFAERKRKYREFGGSYDSHIKYSKEKDPIMLFIINSIENLKENLEDEFDGLYSLYKECAKYGIVFVVSSVEQTVLRGKAMEAFPQVLTTKIANDEYSNVLGNAAKGVIPKNLKGRGLLAINKIVYEYQTASIYEPDKLQAIIKNVNTTLNNYYKTKAIPLPMVPKSITVNHIPMDKISLNNICVGYSKASIEPIYMDLQANFGTLILAPKKFNLSEYCKTFYAELDTLVTDTNKVYLFDANESMKGQRFKNITYVDSSELKNTFNNLKIFVNQEYEKYSAMTDKTAYNPGKRSLIVLHETSACFNMIGDATDDFSSMVDKIRELQLFDFVIADIAADYKEVARDKGLAKTLMDSHGILIGNTYDTQMFIDLNSRDIRQKEALPENEGYVVKNGNGYLSQVLEFTEKEDEDEI